jgi:hypothetical protein
LRALSARLAWFARARARSHVCVWSLRVVVRVLLLGPACALSPRASGWGAALYLFSLFSCSYVRESNKKLALKSFKDLLCKDLLSPVESCSLTLLLLSRSPFVLWTNTNVRFFCSLERSLGG